MFKKISSFLFILAVILLLIFNLSYSQYRSYNQKPPEESFSQKQEQKIESDEKDEDNDNFYIIEKSYWPRIQILQVYSALIVWLSFFMGISIFFIARYAGARVNKLKIWISIFIAVIISILSRGVIIIVRNFLFSVFNSLIQNPPVSSTIADVVTQFIGLLFTAGIAVHLYEIFTVTAKEVFQAK